METAASVTSRNATASRSDFLIVIASDLRIDMTAIALASFRFSKGPRVPAPHSERAAIGAEFRYNRILEHDAHMINSLDASET
jgi:hypothetical protein